MSVGHDGQPRPRNIKALIALARDSVKAWLDDFAPAWCAAISYYTIFSIAPLLYRDRGSGLVFGAEAAAGRIYAELAGLLGSASAEAIQAMVESASKPERSVVGSIVGVVTLLIGATTVFAELQSALDRIWRTPAAAKPEGPFSLLRARVLAFGLILTIGILLLVSLIISAALSAAGEAWLPDIPSWEIVLHLIDIAISFAIVTALSRLSTWLPRATIAWGDV
jgi:membrane protein